MELKALQLSVMVAQLGAALLLYGWPLPRRRHFAAIACVTACVVAMLTAGAMQLGFSPYPTLTDDRSFASAIFSFLVILTVLTTVASALWKAPPLTTLFCSSSAYLLRTIIESADRALHFSGIVAPADITAASFLGPSVSLSLVVFGSFYLLLGRRLNRKGLLGLGSPVMLLAIVLAMAVSIVFDLVVKDVAVYDLPRRYLVVLSWVHLAICVFILIAEFEIIYARTLQESVSTMERIVSEQERQYAVSEQTIDAINRRVHDMRHHVFDILAKSTQSLSQEELQQIAHEINVYDASVKTGNVALDIVLTEKGLLCEQEGIALTCVADGHALDFMAASDIYTLFGTAVDGAIAALKNTGDKNLQAVSLDVRDAMGMASISIEHYLIADEVQNARGKEEGERRLDTMRTIVERYGGTFVYAEGNPDVFHLDVLVPYPV